MAMMTGRPMIRFSLVLLFIHLCGAVISGTSSHLTSHDPLLTSECHTYNRTACMEEGVSCSGVQTCSKSARSRCFSVWTNTTEGGVQVEFKGCLRAVEDCLGNTSCVSTNAETSTEYPHFYCCCVSDNCNAEMSIREPEPVPQPKPPPDGSRVYVMLSAIIGSLLSLVAVTSFVFYCYRRNKVPPYFMALPGGMEATAAVTPDLHSPCTAPQHMPAQTPHSWPLELVEVKAKGRYGALWLAKHRGKDLAVKIFPATDGNSWRLEKEVYSLPQLRHTNILEFMGAELHTDTINTEYWLITAYHSYGSLCDYLQHHTVTWPEVRRIAASMLDGLTFLHHDMAPTAIEGRKPVIAHRDFKSKNVLLKDNLTACIADFGLAIVFNGPSSETHGQHTRNCQVGTRRYMAPEVLEGAISFQSEAFLRIDMYACGLVLWELSSRCTVQTGEVAKYKLPFLEEVGYFPLLEHMQEVVAMRKIRPTIPKSNHPGMMVLAATMEECWDQDSEARLTAACVAERLKATTEHTGKKGDQQILKVTHHPIAGGIGCDKQNQDTNYLLCAASKPNNIGVLKLGSGLEGRINSCCNHSTTSSSNNGGSSSSSSPGNLRNNNTSTTNTIENSSESSQSSGGGDCTYGCNQGVTPTNPVMTNSSNFGNETPVLSMMGAVVVVDPRLPNPRMSIDPRMPDTGVKVMDPMLPDRSKAIDPRLPDPSKAIDPVMPNLRMAIDPRFPDPRMSINPSDSPRMTQPRLQDDKNSINTMLPDPRKSIDPKLPDPSRSIHALLPDQSRAIDPTMPNQIWSMNPAAAMYQDPRKTIQPIVIQNPHGKPIILPPLLGPMPNAFPMRPPPQFSGPSVVAEIAPQPQIGGMIPQNGGMVTKNGSPMPQPWISHNEETDESQH